MFYTFIFGCGLGLFYATQSFLIAHMWIDPANYPVENLLLLICIGIFIYLVQRRFDFLPTNYHQLMLQHKMGVPVAYEHLWWQLILPAVILVSGTSLGPEATLVSTTILFSLFLQDKIKFLLASNWRELRLRDFFNFRRLTHAVPAVFSRETLKLLTIIYYGVGISGFLVIFKLTNQPSMVMTLGHSDWQAKAWLILLPLLALGYALGLLYNRIMQFLTVQLRKLALRRSLLIALGGLAIWLSGLFSTKILFSGQHNFHLFHEGFGNQPIAILLSISFAKLLLITIVKETGWLGGDIFPIIFSATLQGFVVGHFLPNVDLIFAVVIFAMGMSAAMLNLPLVVGSIFAAFYAPTNLWPLVMFATSILLLTKYYLKPHHQEILSSFKKWPLIIPKIKDRI